MAQTSMDHGNPGLYCAMLLGLLALVWLADRRFPILRDLPSDEGTARRQRSYSLGRVQMAFWTIIVMASMIYLGVMNGVLPALDNNLVFLMGISGATGVLATAVDIGKDRAVEDAKAAFAGTYDGMRALDTQINAVLMSRPAKSGPPRNDAALGQLFADRAVKVGDAAKQEMAVSRSSREDASDGFICDLLTDQNGNSLHRLQLILFTLLFGGYVILHVAGSSPSHDLLKTIIGEQALGLMGVAGGIYAGFKLPGKAT